ncbi:hypothetical protein H0E84_05175 [Luteimonas sp. SJ-92]|uniref:CARDB domain-containing protein n=1 Tax=Luteimonas salinisoli TaxID=2752307 RepID=A0A853JAT9_9GAMM|nr:CARDB domain-containing protein [Luteimonas salinisoli]NZA25768.1 hypothetical protein [Luteimonas salinisoli]
MSRQFSGLAAALAPITLALAIPGAAAAQQRVSAAEPAEATPRPGRADDRALRAVAVPPQQADDDGGPGQGRQAQDDDDGGPGQGRQTQDDDGGPGQGRQIMQARVLPDLSLVGAFTIGTGPVGWGTSTQLPASAAVRQQDGRCVFRYAYPTRNQGPGASAAAVNRIFLDAPDGPQLAEDPLPALAAGVASTVSGHILLAPGTWTLYVHADAAQQVMETDEQNNLRRVRVTVEGDCGPRRATRARD